MLDMIFQYEFIRNSVYAGILIGIIGPLMGLFLVVRRLSLMADALSHVTLSGVAFGLLMQQRWGMTSIPPIYVGMGFATLASFFVERLRKVYRHYQEIAIPIMLSTGVALGIILISISNGFNVNLLDYLFGSISAISADDLVMISVLALIIIVVTWLFYKELVIISFDEEDAAITGVSQRLVNFIFTILVAFTIGASMQIVGILLVSAMMTLPVAAALQWQRSFRQTILLAIIHGQISVFLGIYLAFHFDWPSGGTIVLVAAFQVLVILLVKRIRIWVLRRASV
ncbi:metal ABC transporter permease [Rubeoparvulum massiliense]|uniref:metal ABC transporter permease n=1 Tax=Rubeoparvulum massiliense TaxID=1631346 RepID=UPI00065E9293|nr:metal ABC transporter permease [Rubeoparvulum massiliense]